LNHYSVSKYIFRCGETFDVKYIKDLLTNEQYKNVLQIKNNVVTHIHFTNTKKRDELTFDLKKKKIEDYLSDVIKQQECIIHGVSVCFKTLHLNTNVNTKTSIVSNVHLKNEELCDEFKKIEMVELHEKLNLVLEYIENPKMMDRVLIGKQILTNLQNQMVKTIYCTPVKYKKLLEIFSADDITNCEIIIVVSLTSGDPVDILRKNYSGIIGLSYY
jgi:REP element-mobilizing transposase RayT